MLEAYLIPTTKVWNDHAFEVREVLYKAESRIHRGRERASRHAQPDPIVTAYPVATGIGDEVL